MCSLAPTYAAQNEQNKNHLKQKQVKELESLFDQIENEENPKVKFDVKDWDCIITTKKLFSRLISSGNFFKFPFRNEFGEKETKMEVILENKTIFSYLLRKNENNVVTIIEEDDIRKKLINRGLKEVYKPIWFKDTYQEKKFFFILITTLLHHAPTQLQELLVKELLETFKNWLAEEKIYSLIRKRMMVLQDILEENYSHIFNYTDILNDIGVLVAKKETYEFVLREQLKFNKNPYKFHFRDLLDLELMYRNLRVIEKLGDPTDAHNIKTLIEVHEQMIQIDKFRANFFKLLESTYSVFADHSNVVELLEDKVKTLAKQASQQSLKGYNELPNIIPEYITHLCNLYRSIHEKSLKEVLAQIGNTLFFDEGAFNNLGNEDSYLSLLNANWGDHDLDLELNKISKYLIAGPQAARKFQKRKDWEKWCAEYDKIKKEKQLQKIPKKNPYKNGISNYLIIRHYVRSKEVASREVANYWFRKQKIQTVNYMKFSDVSNIISDYVIKQPIDELYSPKDKGSKKIDQMKYYDLLLKPKFARNIAMGHKHPKEFNEYLLDQNYYEKKYAEEINFQLIEVWVATSPARSSEDFKNMIGLLEKDKKTEEFKKNLVRRIVVSTVSEEDAKIQWAKIKFLEGQIDDNSTEGLMINLYVGDTYYRKLYLAKIKEITTYKKEFNQAWHTLTNKYLKNRNLKKSPKKYDKEFSFPSLSFGERGNKVVVKDSLLVYYILNYKDTFKTLMESCFNKKYDQYNENLLTAKQDGKYYYLNSFFFHIPKYGLLENDITSLLEAIDKHLAPEEKKQVARYFLANYQIEFTMEDRKKLASLGGIEGYIPTSNDLLEFFGKWSKESLKTRNQIYQYMIFLSQQTIDPSSLKDFFSYHEKFYWNLPKKGKEKHKQLQIFVEEMYSIQQNDLYKLKDILAEYVLELSKIPQENVVEFLYFSFNGVFNDFLPLCVTNPFSENILNEKQGKSFPAIALPGRFKKESSPPLQDKKTPEKKENINSNHESRYAHMVEEILKEATGGHFKEGKVPPEYNDLFFHRDSDTDSDTLNPRLRQRKRKYKERHNGEPSFSFIRLLINHRLKIIVLLGGIAIFTGKKVWDVIQQKSANKKEEKNEDKDEKQTTNQRKMVKSLKRFRSKKLRS